MNQTVQTLIVLLIASAAMACFTAAPGTFDDYAFIEWAKLLSQPGPFRGYRMLAHRVDLDYPPLGVAIMWLSLRIGSIAGWPDLIAFKIPLVGFTLAGALLALFRRWDPLDALVLLLVGTQFGLILGYTDVVYLPFLLIALYAAATERFAIAGFCLGFAAFIKWQPIILAPIFLAAAVQHAKSPRQFLLIALPTILLVAVILFAFGPVTVCDVLLSATSENYVGGQGVNVAWLISYVFELFHVGGEHIQPNGTITILMTPSPAVAVNWVATGLRLVFYALFIASVGIYIAGRKSRNAFLISALSCALVQFTWNTGVHENHLFVSFVAAFAAWQARALDNFTFAAVAAVADLNILLFDGAGDGFNFANLWDVDGTAFLAAAELLIYIVVVNLQLRICIFAKGPP